MTQRERLERNTKPRKALAVRQKYKRDLKQKKIISNESDQSKPRWVWSDLPDDIVRHIIGKLCWSDRIRLRVVCKSMQSLVHGIQTIDKFPWLMNYNWRETDYGRVYSIFRLADPSAQKSYVIEKAIQGEKKKDFVDAEPCASRNGWVLFNKEHLFFFYSPFTNEVIKLPKFGYYQLTADFSSNPTSPDCVVFILSHDNSNKRCIWTWSLGDKTWTHLYLGVDYHRSLDVTYAGGNFYCIFGDGKLGAYNSVLKEWKLFANVFPVKIDNATAFLIESNEDNNLLLMFFNWRRWQLWRFDLSQKCWIEEQRIGNRAIFLGCTSYSVPILERSCEFANKMYYHIANQKEKKYCLEDIYRKELMCASLEDCALWLKPELYSWMTRRMGSKSIWIQPPLN